MAFIGLPPGSITQFAGSVAPTGWLVCDGSILSRTVYSDLFTALGTTFGAGDGVSTFQIPDCRGRSLFGQGSHADVGTLGNNEGASVGARRPRHKHSVNDPGHAHNAKRGDYTELDGGGPYDLKASAGGNDSRDTANSTATTGITIGPQTGNEPIDSAPYLVVQMIIKY